MRAGNNWVNDTRGLRPRRGAKVGGDWPPRRCPHAAKKPRGGAAEGAAEEVRARGDALDLG